MRVFCIIPVFTNRDRNYIFTIRACEHRFRQRKCFPPFAPLLKTPLIRSRNEISVSSIPYPDSMGPSFLRNRINLYLCNCAVIQGCKSCSEFLCVSVNGLDRNLFVKNRSRSNIALHFDVIDFCPSLSGISSFDSDLIICRFRNVKIKFYLLPFRIRYLFDGNGFLRIDIADKQSAGIAAGTYV